MTILTIQGFFVHMGSGIAHVNPFLWKIICTTSSCSFNEK